MSGRGISAGLRARAALALGRGSGPGAAPTHEAWLQLAKDGAMPLAPRPRSGGGSLSIAAVVPSFRRGSGGHATIVHLLRALRALGHSVSVWLEDCDARHANEPPSVTKRSFAEFYDSDGIELERDFGAWQGADVVLATGWQTVPRALLLSGAGARAYLVQDHEPDFYGASAEALWAQESYRLGLHCVAASPWLAQLLSARYGARAAHFDLGVDHAVYRATQQPRSEQELVAFYARAVTPRRAVPLGLLALDELNKRRPGVQIALFGEQRELAAPFADRQLGVLEPAELAELYSQATVGVVLSLTNPSLIALEMMACGLPCVELASESMLATFGRDGPLELASADPLALCAAVESLLGDRERRARASAAGLELAAQRTWERAARQVQEALHESLAVAG